MLSLQDILTQTVGDLSFFSWSEIQCVEKDGWGKAGERWFIWSEI